jgi:hypothetical protein
MHNHDGHEENPEGTAHVPATNETGHDNEAGSKATGSLKPKRFANALLIVDPGACNPSGIAHAIIEACQEARAEGVDTHRDVAVRLMVTQLAWVCRADSDTEDYGELLAACRRRADSK